MTTRHASHIDPPDSPRGSLGWRCRVSCRARRRAVESCDARKHHRQVVPRHHLRREPRGCDRLRDRRLSARAAAPRGRHPARPGTPPSRQVPPHHAAPGDRRGADPLRRLRRRHHRHPDQSDDRERRSAPQGLQQDQGRIPPLARGLHLSPQVRRPPWACDTSPRSPPSAGD